MKTMTAGRFKSRCLKVVDEVFSTGEPVMITKKGKPIAKLVSVDAQTDEFLGGLRGVMKIVGDIESPIVPPEDWEALR